MDRDMEQYFCDNYIVKKSRARIIYELHNDKKRINALSRFCHSCRDYIDEKKIVYNCKEFRINEIKSILELNSNNKGYIISMTRCHDKQFVSFEKFIAVIEEINMGMIFVMKDYCIITTELESNVRDYIVMKK